MTEKIRQENVTFLREVVSKEFFRKLKQHSLSTRLKKNSLWIKIPSQFCGKVNRKKKKKSREGRRNTFLKKCTFHWEKEVSRLFNVPTVGREN